MKEKVLFFDSDVAYAKSIGEVLKGANIECVVETDDFNNALAIVKREGISVIVVNIHALPDPISLIQDFRANFPKTNILCIYEKGDVPFETAFSSDFYIRRIGRKQYLMATDLLSQVQNFY